MESNETKELNIYEVGYIIVPTIPEENVSKEAGLVKSAIENIGVLVSSLEPKLIPLAYAMDTVSENKKSTYTSGYFGSFVFHAEAKEMEVLKEKLDKNDSLIRFLLIKRSKESLIPPKRRVSYETGEKTEKKEKAPVEKKELDVAALDKTIEELVVN